MTIYKSSEGKAKILALYDAQLQRLQHEYNDLWVDTQFGRTHLIQTGNPDGMYSTARFTFSGQMHIILAIMPAPNDPLKHRMDENPRLSTISPAHLP